MGLPLQASVALPMRLRLLAALALSLAAMTSALSLTGCADEPLDVAEGVDLVRFQGQWFEIGKLPRITQADCTGTTAFYTVRDGGLDVVHQCRLHTLDGELHSRTARAVVNDPTVTAKMKIDVGGFFGDYWVLEVGEHYEYAVVGHPSRDYLWILSRTPSMEQDKLDGILARAREKKFDTSKVELTKQAP